MNEWKDQLRKVIRANHGNVREFARHIKVQPTSVETCLNPHAGGTISTLQSIAIGLNATMVLIANSALAETQERLGKKMIVVKDEKNKFINDNQLTLQFDILEP